MLARARVWRLENPDKARANVLKSSQTETGKLRRKEYYAANKDAIRLYKQKHYQANKAYYTAKSHAWHLENPDAVKASQAKYARSEKHRQTSQEWYQENKLWLNEQRRTKRKSYTRQVFADKLRTLVRNVLRAHGSRKADKTEDVIGCTIEFLKEHLESQFRPGMSMANHGKWHIDHIVPCARFDLTDPKQQKACFNYKNLQPLWATENIKKGSRYGQTSCSPT